MRLSSDVALQCLRWSSTLELRGTHRSYSVRGGKYGSFGVAWTQWTKGTLAHDTRFTTYAESISRATRPARTLVTRHSLRLTPLSTLYFT